MDGTEDEIALADAGAKPTQKRATECTPTREPKISDTDGERVTSYVVSALLRFLMVSTFATMSNCCPSTAGTIAMLFSLKDRRSISLFMTTCQLSDGAAMRGR
jgi:hypothetical protein